MPILRAVRSMHMLRGLKAWRSCILVVSATAGRRGRGGRRGCLGDLRRAFNPPSKATAEVSQARPPTATMAVETARIFIRDDICEGS